MELKLCEYTDGSDRVVTLVDAFIITLVKLHGDEVYANDPKYLAVHDAPVEIAMRCRYYSGLRLLNTNVLLRPDGYRPLLSVLGRDYSIFMPMDAPIRVHSSAYGVALALIGETMNEAIHI